MYRARLVSYVSIHVHAYTYVLTSHSCRCLANASELDKKAPSRRKDHTEAVIEGFGHDPKLVRKDYGIVPNLIVSFALLTHLKSIC